MKESNSEKHQEQQETELANESCTFVNPSGTSSDLADDEIMRQSSKGDGDHFLIS